MNIPKHITYVADAVAPEWRRHFDAVRIERKEGSDRAVAVGSDGAALVAAEWTDTDAENNGHREVCVNLDPKQLKQARAALPKTRDPRPIRMGERLHNKAALFIETPVGVSKQTIVADLPVAQHFLDWRAAIPNGATLRKADNMQDPATLMRFIAGIGKGAGVGMRVEAYRLIDLLTIVAKSMNCTRRDACIVDLFVNASKQGALKVTSAFPEWRNPDVTVTGILMPYNT